ncbi:MAG: carbon storage regulator CsrA [Nitrospinales bacterium]
MLVLTRKIGESIKINEDVKITVIEVKGKNIRLGIEAPKETKIYREEVFLKIKQENKSAASSTEFDMNKVSQIMNKKIKP